MEGREAIVGRIIADAHEAAERKKQEAAVRADAVTSEAERCAQIRLEEARRALEREAGEKIARREIIAELDCRKRLLAARRGATEAVFSRALELMCAMEKEKYRAVLEELLKRYAEEGDEVLLSRYAPVTEKELTDCKVFAKKKLRFAGNDGAFEGGMRLSSRLCEKDLSFRALIEAKRFELEREIVAMLPAEK